MFCLNGNNRHAWGCFGAADASSMTSTSVYESLIHEMPHHRIPPYPSMAAARRYRTPCAHALNVIVRHRPLPLPPLLSNANSNTSTGTSTSSSTTSITSSGEKGSRDRSDENLKQNKSIRCAYQNICNPCPSNLPKLEKYGLKNFETKCRLFPNIWRWLEGVKEGEWDDSEERGGEKGYRQMREMGEVREMNEMREMMEMGEVKEMREMCRR